MTTAKQTAFRFTPADLALLEALQRKLGIVNRTEIIRLALRRLADLEGVTTALDAPRKSKVGSTGRRA